MNIKSKPYFTRKNIYQAGLIFFLVFLTSLFQNCGRRYIPEELGNSDLNSNNIVGAQLYSEHCAVCHNPLGSTTINDKSEAGIQNALQTQNQMKFISITQEEITQIAAALNPAVETASKLRDINNIEESGELAELVEDDNEMKLDSTDQGNEEPRLSVK